LELLQSAETNNQVKHGTTSLMKMHTYSRAVQIIDTLVTSDFSKVSNHAVPQFQKRVPKTPLSALLHD